MKPSEEEIEAALTEEREALAQFARASQSITRDTLKLQAARKRLSLARSHKWAITNDLMTYA